MDKKEKQRLLCNLEKISQKNPTLNTRLRWPVELDHIAFDGNNEPVYNLHDTWYHFSTPGSQISKVVRTPQKEFFLFGVGFGEYIRFILSNYPDSKIIAWERDPAVLRVLLMHNDYTRYITQGRLKFLLGVDLIPRINELDFDSIIFHPFFTKLYQHEYLALKSKLTKNFIAIALGGLFVDDLASTLLNSNFVPWPVELQRWSVEELKYSILKIDPLFLASINYTSGTSEFCERLELPLLCWEIDPNMSMNLKMESSSQFTYIFTYRKNNLQIFKNAGFENYHYLPLASNTEKRVPVNTNKKHLQYNVPLAFVGRSMVAEASLYRKNFIDLYSNFTSNSLNSTTECETKIQDILDQQYQDGSKFIIPDLYKNAFPGFKEFLVSHQIDIDPLKILSQIAASERRLYYVARLGKFNIHVWGDDDWRCIEEYGAKFMGLAGHHYELTQIYSGAVINIDIGRLYQLDIVTMRVFDVLACGGFLIAEYSDDLNELFQIGHELESYKTLDELEDKIIYYHENPSKIQSIAQNGLKAIKTRHSFQKRVEYMLNVMRISC